MRKWFMKIVALALPLTFAVSSQTDAAALYDGNAFYKSQGFSSSRVASMPWWEDPSVTTYGYAGILSTARNSWDAAPSANIGYNKTSSESSAYLRFYVIDDPYQVTMGALNPLILMVMPSLIVMQIILINHSINQILFLMIIT